MRTTCTHFQWVSVHILHYEDLSCGDLWTEDSKSELLLRIWFSKTGAGLFYESVMTTSYLFDVLPRIQTQQVIKRANCPNSFFNKNGRNVVLSIRVRHSGHSAKKWPECRSSPSANDGMRHSGHSAKKWLECRTLHQHRGKTDCTHDFWSPLNLSNETCSPCFYLSQNSLNGFNASKLFYEKNECV